MKHVALLRSINVGKHNRVSMTALKKALADRGLEGADTYLQSGNVLFDWDPTCTEEVAGLFAQAFADLGISSIAVIRSSHHMSELVKLDPFARFELGDNRKFVAFLDSPLADPLPLLSKKGDLEIAIQSQIDVCFVSHPVEAVPNALALPKGRLATVRNWAVTKEIARLLA